MIVHCMRVDASPTDEEFEGENSNFEVYPVLNRKLVDLLRLYSSSLDDINYPLIARTVLTTETSLPLSLTQYRYRRYSIPILSIISEYRYRRYF